MWMSVWPHNRKLNNIYTLRNAGFSLLGHFSGLFLIFFTQVLVSFSVTKLLMMETPFALHNINGLYSL